MTSLSLTYTVPAGASVGFTFTSSTNITISWGDGSPDYSVPNTTSTTSRTIPPHTYTTAGTYNILISGDFLNSLGNPSSDQQGIQYLTSVNSFGNLGITSLAGAFRSATSLTSLPSTSPSTVTNMSHMFYNANIVNANISNWTTSNVTDMSYMFTLAHAFDQNLSSWDMSKVTNMSNMFANTNSFNNGGVALGWTTIGTSGSQVDMLAMFARAIAFNANISTWNMSNVTNMSYMFSRAFAFNNGGVALGWTTIGASGTQVNMSNMFFTASAFNQNISSWNLSNVTNMTNMFQNATVFNNGDLALGWTTIGTSGRPVNMSNMFRASEFNANISSWNMSNVTNMASMFQEAGSFNNGGAALGWTTIGASGTQVDMSNMFYDARSFNQNISNWNLSNVTNMSNMFRNAFAFNNGGVALGWTTIGASDTQVNMSNMFYDARSFNQNISSWDVSNVTNMTGMFLYSGLLTDNFDNMVNAWALLQTVQEYVILDAPTRSSYSNTGYGTLTATYGWNITAELVPYTPPIMFSNVNSTFAYTNLNKQTVDGNIYDLYYNYGSVDIWLDSFPATPLSGTTYTFNNVKPIIAGTDIFTIKNRTDSNTVIDSVIVIVEDVFSLTYTIPPGNVAVTLNLGDATNITIDWGDGSQTSGINGSINQGHPYTNTTESDMQYTIVISGDSLESFSIGSGRQYLTSVNSFGDLGITSLQGAFQGITQIFTVPAFLPSSVTNVMSMFNDTRAFNQDLSNWDMTKVSNMQSMFSNARAFNNGGVALSWTYIGTTAITFVNISYMFAGAIAFNQDISNWDTSNVSNMQSMFQNATAFNQDISGWNTSNVLNMQSMFQNATAFNEDLSSWVISNVINMTDMFSASGLLTDNFDNMVNAWALQNVEENVTLDAPTRSSFSQDGYDTLRNENGWIIDARIVTYTNELKKWYANTFTYRNQDKPPLEETIYQLLYGNDVLSTYTASSGDTSYTFDNVVINTPGILVFTIQKQSDNTVIDSVNVTVNAVCFKEGSKILCFKNNVEKYVPIENIRKGDLVKTRLNGYVPVHMIGKSQMYHKKTSERRKEQLYTCSKEKFEEVFEDLVITGCHSILVDKFTSEKQRKKAIETNNNRIFITDKKYRLPACVDDRTAVYEKEGLYTIYHLALENDDYYMNYGIYANGLLVETSSKRYLTELSGMEII